jgi:predicted metal-dependent hydrolase
MFSLVIIMDQLSLVKCTIVLILIITFYMFLETDYVNDVKFVKSDLDGSEYLVRNAKDSIKAANMLSKIRVRLTDVVNSLVTKYPKDPRTKRLKERFNPYKISESSPTSQYTSYSVNKGEKIVFCLRTKDSNQELHDFNTITFVALHELAHLMTESVGHTQEFWDNFRFILKNAIQKGYYSFHDFRSKPIKYCGTSITDSPLKENELFE